MALDYDVVKSDNKCLFNMKESLAERELELAERFKKYAEAQNMPFDQKMNRAMDLLKNQVQKFNEI